MLSASSKTVSLSDKNSFEGLMDDFEHVQFETYHPTGSQNVENLPNFQIQIPTSDRDVLLLSHGYVRVRYHITDSAGNGIPNLTKDQSVTSNADLIFSNVEVAKGQTIVFQGNNFPHITRINRLLSASASLREELREELFDISDGTSIADEPYDYGLAERYHIEHADGATMTAHIPLSRFLGLCNEDLISIGEMTFRFQRPGAANRNQFEGPGLNANQSAILHLTACSLHIPVGTMREKFAGKVKKALAKPQPIKFDRFSAQISPAFQTGAVSWQLSPLNYPARYAVFAVFPDSAQSQIHTPKSVYGRYATYDTPDTTVYPAFEPNLQTCSLTVNGSVRIPNRTPQPLNLVERDYMSYYQTYQALSGRSSRNSDSSTVISYGAYQKFALMVFDLSSLSASKTRDRSIDLTFELSTGASEPYRICAYLCEDVSAELGLNTRGETTITMV